MKLAALVVWGGGCADDGGPRLSSVSPASAGIGASVELRGDRFCGATANCADAGGHVELGITQPLVQAPVLDYADTSATIQIPALAPSGTTSIVLTVDGRSSNALAFEVLLVP